MGVKRGHGGVEVKQPQYKVVDLRDERFHFKELAGETGGFSGIANATGVLDDVGDICAKGAFLAHANEFLANGWIAPDHTWGYKDAVGFPTLATEDEQGFRITMAYHPTPDAQAIRQKVSHRLANGKSVKLSIGYDILDFEVMSGKKGLAYLTNPTPEDSARCEGREMVRVLKELLIFEVSIVSVPANSASIVTEAKNAITGAAERAVELITKKKKGIMGGRMISVKAVSEAVNSGDFKALFEDAIEESNESFYFLTNLLYRVIWQIRRADEAAEFAGLEYDMAGQLKAALDEFAARVFASIVEEDEEEDNPGVNPGEVASEADEEELDDSEEDEASGEDPADKGANRGETKEARTLSMSNRKQLTAHVKALEVHGKGTLKQARLVKAMLASADAGKLPDEAKPEPEKEDNGKSISALRSDNLRARRELDFF